MIGKKGAKDNNNLKAILFLWNYFIRIFITLLPVTLVLTFYQAESNTSN
jgi:hypothetical protein